MTGLVVDASVVVNVLLGQDTVAGSEVAAGMPLHAPALLDLEVLSALGMAAVLALMVFGLTNDLFCP